MDRYLASIVENLNNVLNTKKDFGSVLTDMGIRDLNEFRSRDDIATVVVEEVKKKHRKVRTPGGAGEYCPARKQEFVHFVIQN